MAKQPSILSLVGRLIKGRLREFGREARGDMREGYNQFRQELEEELQPSKADGTGEVSAGRSE